MGGEVLQSGGRKIPRKHTWNIFIGKEREKKQKIPKSCGSKRGPTRKPMVYIIGGRSGRPKTDPGADRAVRILA